MPADTDQNADCEYVVVGSGAGGGTLAARLADAGRRVVLLEAGGDPKRLLADGAGPREDDYSVPAFHPFATESDPLKWNFFVRHYGSDAVQEKDEKFSKQWQGKRVDGVLYPRAGTLGGCTAHNAMIMVYPHNADWDAIATATGDDSWAAARMRRHFVRLEDCCHRPLMRWLNKLGLDVTRHGWEGWLQTEKAIPRAALTDKKLIEVIAESALAAFAEIGDPAKRLPSLLEGAADPNDWRLVNGSAEGLCYTPLTTRNHERMGARERVLEVAAKRPGYLHVELNALAASVVIDASNRAVGVDYLAGERLYRAHSQPNREAGLRRRVRASREVILAGGAFNTPQLLMLSGIGPPELLRRYGIPVRVNLQGVGRNLQDRYEVSIVNRMSFDRWKVLDGARFAKGDPQYRMWATKREGIYATNGSGLALVKRSFPDRPLPDLFIVAFLGLFKGYFPGYSTLIAEHPNYLSWTVLKGHTNNRAGEVTLRSADPRDTPCINFRYFEEGDDAAGEDLASVVEGIKFARGMTRRLKEMGLIAEETLPGEHLQSDDELRDFVRYNAWGHHASCTCPIGPREQGGVLSSDFRVHGLEGLRVVDASVFPRIPGLFIASAVYMVAEKAAEVILADARTPGPSSGLP